MATGRWGPALVVPGVPVGAGRESGHPGAAAAAASAHGRQGYCPKSGSRFSTKASRPSWPSSVM
jgi:hypothetical protein